MRLLDQILAGRGPEIDRAQFKIAMEGMEAFDVSNVAEYLYAQTDQEVWDVKADFPCLAPPFPKFWMEFARPSKIVSEIEGVRGNQGLPHRVGLWFEFAEIAQLPALFAQQSKQREMLKNVDALLKASEREFTPEIDRELRAFFADGQRSACDPKTWDGLSKPAHLALSRILQLIGLQRTLQPEWVQDSTQRLLDEGARWAGVCQVFIQIERSGCVYGPLGQQEMMISGEGRVVGEVSGKVNTRLIACERWTFAGAGFSTLWFSGLLAISFLHCKNVTVAREGVPPKLAKRRAERGASPRVVFKTLEIAPMKRILERTQSEHATGLQRALHICRGHFAIYEDRGLFGKYKGKFWIPQHVRGAIQEGVVYKDYLVKAPK